MGWQTCCTCGEPFMLHPETEAALRRSEQTYCCPWGHKQHYVRGPSEADKLRQERDRLKQKALATQLRATYDAEIIAERARKC